MVVCYITLTKLIKFRIWYVQKAIGLKINNFVINASCYKAEIMVAKWVASETA